MLKIVMVLIILFLPVFMYALKEKFAPMATVFTCLAYFSFLAFSIIASLTVYDIIVTHRVFMTTVHRIFLNPVFITSASYLGLHLLYLLFSAIIKQRSTPF
ncbi:transposase [Fictibacillus fluitans]|uniref:Transposase n=1 Tax=Fictibacillus fluitans TaxID=3058422 RepID=A0ABT8HQV8_9BACL|nr:transposase [Fictibacillus sp. NE201]MDN4523126.1 transposase [Fictibacillus sp. NE201]